VRPGAPESGHSDRIVQRHRRRVPLALLIPPPPCVRRGSGRGPRESLDAPENLPKESRRQVALRQLQDEVAGMEDEPPAGLEQPLLQARQRPALDGERQDQPTQEIAEVIGWS